MVILRLLGETILARLTQRDPAIPEILKTFEMCANSVANCEIIEKTTVSGSVIAILVITGVFAILVTLATLVMYLSIRIRLQCPSLAILV